MPADPPLLPFSITLYRAKRGAGATNQGTCLALWKHCSLASYAPCPNPCARLRHPGPKHGQRNTGPKSMATKLHRPDFAIVYPHSVYRSIMHMFRSPSSKQRMGIRTSTVQAAWQPHLPSIRNRRASQAFVVSKPVAISEACLLSSGKGVLGWSEAYTRAMNDLCLR